MLTSIGGQPNLTAQSSLQSALQMEQQSPPQVQQAQPQQPPTKRRRKNNTEGGDDEGGPAETRRLRRAHEACSRCRSKKIKCDSKHPKCTACSTAGADCQQEDRHRKTFTPRGYTERLEQQLAQCHALLKHHVPGFEADNIETMMARDGVQVEAASMYQLSSQPGFRAPASPNDSTKQLGPSGPMPPHPQLPPNGPYQQVLMYQPPPGYPQGGVPMPYPLPPGAFPGQYMQPAFPAPYPIPTHENAPPPHEIPGQDPRLNDMSSTHSLAKSFGVNNVHLTAVGGILLDDDLVVGSSGLASGRDRIMLESSSPRGRSLWQTVSVRHSLSTAPAIAMRPPTHPSIEIWVPKDRAMVNSIVEAYFTRLNTHRPVFFRKDFERRLDALYAGVDRHDPGFICSFYLILALGTLSELNNRAGEYYEKAKEEDPYRGELEPAVHKKLMPAEWPEHDEFVERALTVKPELRVSVSSLQALILLHLYLYTERQGRTLWRLVGSLVRLSIELGLHHNPIGQRHPSEKGKMLFTEEEAQLRIRLWGIVLIHDRGTSLLLGRPLAIAPSDANTPRPSRPRSPERCDFSEHFELSHAITEIQADIINSLYSPSRMNGDTSMRYATRIIQTMSEFRKTLPEAYKPYFGGTDDWSPEQRSQLVADLTEDQGLTLLKFGISRILLLRALFNLEELGYERQVKALTDAMITCHNIIIIHTQLIHFPNIAFFTSPIPLHIAAMVILYGHRHNHRIPRQTVVEDIWLALDMIPRFRWRWERKDEKGGHPLLAQIAERLLQVDLQNVKAPQHLELIPEQEWEDGSILSPSIQPTALTHPGNSSNVVYASPGSPMIYGPHPKGMNAAPNGNNGHMTGGAQPHSFEVPPPLLYPFYPETAAPTHQDYHSLVAAAAAPPLHETYISEDRLVPQMWSQQQQQQRHQQVYPPDN